MGIMRLLDECSEEPSYCTYRIGTKRRLIAAPSPGLYKLHQALIVRLNRARVALPNATGSIPGGSLLRNVLPHKDSRYFYVLDFKDAFPSIRAEQLALVLLRIDPSLGTFGEVFDFLERYCLLPGGGLMQGGPASPLLFNLFCESEVDQQLRALLVGEGEQEIVYTRYVDDLTFSSAHQPLPKTLRWKIHRIIEAAGFVINWEKTYPLVRGTNAIEITGVRLLGGSSLGLTADFRKRFERKLDTWLGSADEAKETSEIDGLIGHYRSLRPSLEGNRLIRRLDVKASRVRGRLSNPDLERQMRLTKEYLDTLRRLTPLAELIEPRVKKFRWRRGGKREATALCPFHQEKSPSFTISVRNRFFHCFGCGAHGDVFDWIGRTENLYFLEAVQRVAEMVGMPVPKRRPHVR